MTSDYYNKNYNASAKSGGDNIEVSKGGGSDWVNLSLWYNPDNKVRFELRSRRIVEHLHFMLGQFLRETE